MSTITTVIVVNVVLCVLIFAGQLWQLTNALREPKGEFGSTGARLLARWEERRAQRRGGADALVAEAAPAAQTGAESSPPA